MKILSRLKTDAKAMIQDLRETNETLLNTLTDYQDIIFEQRETIDCQSQEIERLQRRNLELQHGILSCKSEAIKEFAERLKAISHPYGDTQMVFELQIDNLVKEMVGDGDA